MSEARPEAWTYAALTDLRSRVRAMGRDFDLTVLASKVGRPREDVDVALFALAGRSIVQACEVLR